MGFLQKRGRSSRCDRNKELTTEKSKKVNFNMPKVVCLEAICDFYHMANWKEHYDMVQVLPLPVPGENEGGHFCRGQEGKRTAGPKQGWGNRFLRHQIIPISPCTILLRFWVTLFPSKSCVFRRVNSKTSRQKQKSKMRNSIEVQAGSFHTSNWVFQGSWPAWLPATLGEKKTSCYPNFQWTVSFLQNHFVANGFWNG